jgi:hypothetical protein
MAGAQTNPAGDPMDGRRQIRRNVTPDWVAVQRTGQGEASWIIETKGRVWEDTAVKDTAMRDGCARISQQTRQRWEYARVNQSIFEAHKPRTLVEATQMSGQENGRMTF